MTRRGSDGEAAPEELEVLEVLEVAREGAAAIAANDVEGMARFLAEDWVIVDADGPSPRDRFLDLVTSGALSHSSMEIANEPRVRIFGDVALVTARITNTAHYEGRRFDADEWTTDVLVRAGRGWRCVLSHITSVHPSAS
jgi:ketosteroid isomerase-like protein